MSTLLSRLLELCDEYALPAIAATLGTFDKPEVFEVDVKAAAPAVAAPELTELLTSLARRGLDPALIPSLLGHFEGRPLERGLIAWDVLCGTIWPTAEDDVFAQLQEAAKAIPEISAEPRQQVVDLNRHDSVKLITRYALPAVTEPMAEAKSLGLGGLETLRLQAGKAEQTVLGASFRSGLTDFGRLLARSRLPSLAAVYLDYAVRALEESAALPVLCETLFDAKATARIPGDLIDKYKQDTPEWADFAEYMVYRGLAATPGQSLQAYSALETNRKLRGTTPQSDRFVVAQGLLAPLFDDPVPSFERIDEIAQKNPWWRAAWGLRIAAAAQEAPAGSTKPLEIAEDFVRRFGHDWERWYHAFRVSTTTHETHEPWKLLACTSIGAEIALLPHNPDAWKALVCLVADDDSVNEVLAEVNEQLEDQSEL